MPLNLIRLLALAPAGGAVWLGIIRKLSWPFIGFLAMLSMIPSQEVTVLSSGRTLVWALGVGVIGVWSLQTLTKGKVVRIAGRPLVLIVSWICWCAISIFWARDEAAALSGLLALGQLLAFFVLIQVLVATDDALRNAVAVYFWASVFVAALTIAVSLSLGLRRAFLVDQQNPNALARALGVGLLMTPLMLRGVSRSRLRLSVVGGAAATAVAILLTGSRGSWVGLVASIATVWLLVRSGLMRFRTAILLGIALLFGLVALYSSGIVGDYTIRRIITLPSIEATSGWSGRTRIWSVGWEMVKHQPFAGVGLGNFPMRFDEYIEPAGQVGAVDTSRDPHNTFLSVQAETGIVGSVLFLLSWIAIFFRLVKVRGDPRGVLGLLLLVFILATGMSGTIIYMKSYWLSIGLAATIPEVIRRDAA